MSFPHRKIIEENEIETASLPEEAVQAIEKFDALIESLEEVEDDEDKQDLQNQAMQMSNEISDIIRDHLDNEVRLDIEEKKPEPKPKPEPKGDPNPIELTAEQKDESVIEMFLNSGITKASRNELKRNGFDVSNLNHKGGTYGKYHLKKDTFSIEYHLTKLED